MEEMIVKQLIFMLDIFHYTTIQPTLQWPLVYCQHQQCELISFKANVTQYTAYIVYAQKTDTMRLCTCF